MILQRIFNCNGRFFDETYDPYRRSDTPYHTVIHNFLFDEDGNLNEGSLQDDIVDFITENRCSWGSDIVKLYWANEFAMNTKGNYSAIYMWR